MSGTTIAVVNASGRQAASFIRVASAVGYHVRAQLRNLVGVVAQEVSSLPNVTCLEGELYYEDTKSVNTAIIKDLFTGVQLAFINTIFYGDEVAIGKALADEAKKVNIQHYIYSSMPDHSRHNPHWPALPMWSAKTKVEDYIRALGLPATFIYTGIYNNNFTSLPYPLFCMELQEDGTFVWQAPFHPKAKLPWLDAEHDVGAAVLQLIKDGPGSGKGGRRVALAFEMLTPLEVCQAFSRGLDRLCMYVRGPIEVNVHIPDGYREQLDALEQLYDLDQDDPEQQPPYFGSKELEASCPEEALKLWEGYRSVGEYAKEIFPIEERNNGLTWMNEGDELADAEVGSPDDGDDDDDDDVLTMGRRRREEAWLA